MLVELCRVADVSPDQPLRCELNGEELAVFQVGATYYVTQDHCTHGPGSLADGYLDGEEIECPFHQGRFNVISGQATMAPCTVPLRIWTVTVRDGGVYVDSDQHAAVVA